ncbi:MAG: alpha/beta hydrolase, partial [Spirochaetaceae bacterium]|nr:alpha/beta hydrolase [Spirochaetaceae bacterium]
RGKTGEHIKDITGRFPFWFCRNYQKYSENEDALPFDQHHLLALIAPRLIYVSSRTMDSWADPASEFKACNLASPAYRLYNKIGLALNEMPLPETPSHEGEIGYHIKTGIHDMDEYDWERYLEYCSARFHPVT